MDLLKYRIKTLFRYQDLIRELVSRDLKLKYRRSFLGYVWSILNPLMIMIVLAIVFSNLLGKNIENYPVYLFTGRLLFGFALIFLSVVLSETHFAFLRRK